MARTLVRLGADPARRDGRFDGRPLDWARHGYQEEVAAYLESVTPAEEGEPGPGGPGPG